MEKHFYLRLNQNTITVAKTLTLQFLYYIDTFQMLMISSLLQEIKHSIRNYKLVYDQNTMYNHTY